ncbi:MAG: acyl--CoA ligase [bacterium]|nr:acyl--CoA ligase [bacterium]
MNTNATESTVQQQNEPPIDASTLRELVESFSADKLDYDAISMIGAPPGSGVTYGKLREQVRALGNMLLKMGVKKGDKLGILSENRLEWPQVYLAIASIGAIIMPCDIFLGPEDMVTVINESHIDMIFTSAFFLEKVMTAGPDLTNLEKIICFDGHQRMYDDINSKGEISVSAENFLESIEKITAMEIDLENPFSRYEFLYFDSLVSGGKLLKENGVDLYSGVEVAPDDIMTLCYLHGTTFAMFSHSAIMANMKAINTGLFGNGKYVNAGDLCLATIPFHHTFPTMTCFLVVFSVYVHTIIQTTFRVGEIIDAINTVKAKYIPTVPLIVEKIYQRGKKAGMRFEHLDFFISGGAPIRQDVIEGMEEMDILVLQGYGLTEYSPVVSTNTPRANKIGSIGRALPGVTVKIEKPDDKGHGELLVKGPSLMTGYYCKPEETAEIIDDQGWLHTGDIAIIDDEGFIFITGRLKKIIVTKGGKNVYPEDVENLLLRSPFIAEVRVLPVDDPKKGEYPHAYIRPDFDAIARDGQGRKEDLSPDDIKNIIQSEIKRVSAFKALYKIPGDYDIITDDFSSVPVWEDRLMFETGKAG